MRRMGDIYNGTSDVHGTLPQTSSYHGISAQLWPISVINGREAADLRVMDCPSRLIGSRPTLSLLVELIPASFPAIEPILNAPMDIHDPTPDPKKNTRPHG